jgi:hypothetical protein
MGHVARVPGALDFGRLGTRMAGAWTFPAFGHAISEIKRFNASGCPRRHDRRPRQVGTWGGIRGNMRKNAMGHVARVPGALDFGRLGTSTRARRRGRH